MPATVHVEPLDLSRRRLLRGAGLIAGGGLLVSAGLAARPATAATNKLTQQAAGYQPTPKGKQRCDNCALYQAPNACQVVNGPIKPTGWCKLYSPKA